jgi:hypothetical protein
VTRLVHFLYTGELVAGADQLAELKSLAHSLGIAALIEQIDRLHQQIFNNMHQHKPLLLPLPASSNRYNIACQFVGSRVVDPDPDWIRIQRFCGSGSVLGIRIRIQGQDN